MVGGHKHGLMGKDEAVTVVMGEITNKVKRVKRVGQAGPGQWGQWNELSNVFIAQGYATNE